MQLAVQPSGTDDMIVEFVGCSGAGKTTLARGLADGALTRGAVMARDLILDRPGRRWVTNPQAVNVVADLTALPWLWRARERNREFVRYAFERLDRYAPSTFARLNYKRNIVRRVGLHEMAVAHESGVPVLADEGVVLTAYHLFVYSDAPYSQSELEHFANLVPLPDRIVYVKAPVEALIDRALIRADPRRELAKSDHAELGRQIQRAVEVFDVLASCAGISARLVTIENTTGSDADRNARLQWLAAQIEGSPIDDSAATLAPPDAIGA